MTVPKLLPLISTVVVAVAIAGCGSSGSSGSSGTDASSGGGLYGGGGGTATQAASAPAAAGAARVALSDGHLVDAQGRTLYLFEADTTSESTCSGACAQGWPHATTSGAPTAGDGVNASLLKTSKRSDGGTQVTYDGHPLYRFAGDSAAGQTNGEGVNAFGAAWFMVSAAGGAVEG